MATPNTRNLAVFCDFENVAIGIKEANYPDFRVHLILERLLHIDAFCDYQRRF